MPRQASRCAGLAAMVLSLTPVIQIAHAQRHELLKLLPEDSGEREYFGCSASMNDSVILIGAYGDRPNGFLSGATYLFDLASGRELSRFYPADGHSVDEFGLAVAITGDIALIGAPLRDEHGANSGAAYLFDISDPRRPVELTTLLPDEGSDGANFGWTVAAAGPVAVVSAYRDDDLGERSGSVYVFDISDPQRPVRIFKLLAEDGVPFQEFGSALAIDGETILIGAPADDNEFGENAGSVYVFNALTGRQDAKLLSPNARPAEDFGRSVALHGAAAVVGAPSPSSSTGPGAAYLFDLPTRTPLATLVPPDRYERDNFGHRVAVKDTTVVVLAPLSRQDGEYSGRTSVFELTSGFEVTHLVDSATESAIGLFSALVLSGDRAVIGALGEDTNGELAGAAYVFSTCFPDLTGDGVTDTRDVIVYLRYWAKQDPHADWDRDGTVDADDLGVFLNAWVAGC